MALPRDAAEGGSLGLQIGQARPGLGPQARAARSRKRCLSWGRDPELRFRWPLSLAAVELETGQGEQSSEEAAPWSGAGKPSGSPFGGKGDAVERREQGWSPGF